MTQALNLANFANNLNTSGQTSNSGLQNSTITIAAGTGLSGGGTPALGGSVTLNNAGVISVAAGTGISLSGSAGSVTITNSAPATASTVAKAWCNFNSNGGSISIYASYNISSVTYNSTGYFTANFSSSLADANYAVMGTNSVDTGTNQFTVTQAFVNPTSGALVSPSASSFVLSCGQAGYGSRNPQNVMFVVFR